MALSKAIVELHEVGERHGRAPLPRRLAARSAALRRCARVRRIQEGEPAAGCEALRSPSIDGVANLRLGDERVGVAVGGGEWPGHVDDDDGALVRAEIESMVGAAEDQTVGAGDGGLDVDLTTS